MRQRTKDILGGLAVTWIFAAIVSVAMRSPAALVLVGVPAVVFLWLVMYSFWLILSGRA